MIVSYDQSSAVYPQKPETVFSMHRIAAIHSQGVWSLQYRLESIDIQVGGFQD